MVDEHAHPRMGYSETNGPKSPVLPAVATFRQALTPRCLGLRVVELGVLRGDLRSADSAEVLALEPLEVQAVEVAIDSAASAEDWVRLEVSTPGAWRPDPRPVQPSIFAWAHNPRDWICPSG